MQNYLNRLDSILSEVFAGYASSFSQPGILLSGGIDSSTAAFYTSRHFSGYTIYSMGTGATKDRQYVEIMARFLGQPYTWVELRKKEMEGQMETVRGLLMQSGVPANLMQLSLAMGYFLIFRKAHEEGITHIITGQGPDILLGGYHKYKSVSDVNREIRKDLPLLETDKRRDGAMASYWGITLHNPYLEPAFVDLSLDIPAGYKIREGREKFILRELARTKGLPAEITGRPKKAFQYSTGLQNSMRDIVE